MQQRGTKKSDQEIEKLRAKTVNTLDAALSILSRKGCWLKNRVLVVFGDIINNRHQQDVVQLRTQKGCLEFYRALCVDGHVPSAGLALRLWRSLRSRW